MDSELELRSLARRIISVHKAAQEAEQSYNHEPDGPLTFFGVKVSALRRERGMVLDELAEKAGMDSETLLSIELGAASIGEISSYLLPLSDALGGMYPELSKTLLALIQEE